MHNLALCGCVHVCVCGVWRVRACVRQGMHASGHTCMLSSMHIAQHICVNKILHVFSLSKCCNQARIRKYETSGCADDSPSVLCIIVIIVIVVTSKPHNTAETHFHLALCVLPCWLADCLGKWSPEKEIFILMKQSYLVHLINVRCL